MTETLAWIFFTLGCIFVFVSWLTVAEARVILKECEELYKELLNR